MATPRRHLIDPAEGGVFHCISRCVRRAYLCGWDAVSGRSFEHRREWVRERIRELAGQFAVDVYAYAVMSNHQHIILGTDPERVKCMAGNTRHPLSGNTRYQTSTLRRGRHSPKRPAPETAILAIP